MPTTAHHDRRWLVLLFLGLAQLMVVLDATIVNIALPSAQRDLGFGDDSRQWIITAYSLAFGSLLLFGGRLSDLFGRKWTFIAGALGFATASAVGGVADSFGVLVAARAAQGVFGALLAPAALSILTTTFTDPKERGKAFGIFTALAGGGGAIGLLLGGILTDALTWRWCLYVNLAFAIPAAVGAFTLLTNQRAERRPRLDLKGVAMASTGLFALVYGFNHAETASWGDGLTVAALAVGVTLLAAFAAFERRVSNPLLPLRVVLDRNRGGAYLAIGTAGAGVFGVFLFLTFYLQSFRGYSPIETGVSFLPMTASIVFAATMSTTRLLPRFGPKPLVFTGMTLAATGMALLTRIGLDTGYASHVLPSLILIGLGFGLIISAGISTATLGVRASDAGVASAMVNTMQQIGGSLGTAFLSTVAASAGGRLPADAIHGFTTAFWWSAAIFATGAVVCGALLRTDAKLAHGAQPALAH
jgi:EmrB/QacA subfamily drug resistance transporter